MEYDALAHWIYKVKVFYQGGTVSNLKGLTYDYYPHLGSYLWAFFWKNILIKNEYLGRLFFLYIFLISIFFYKIKIKWKVFKFWKDNNHFFNILSFYKYLFVWRISRIFFIFFFTVILIFFTVFIFQKNFQIIIIYLKSLFY